MLELDENAPPPAPGPERYVRRVRCKERITCTCISRTYWSIWTHWDGKRSHPHHKDVKKCPGCRAGWPKRWKAYLHIHNGNCNSYEFLELTPGAIQQLESQMPDCKNFRGWRFRIERGNGDKSRFTIVLLAHHSAFPGVGELVPEEDPKPTLLALWGLNDVVFGDDNQGPAVFKETA